MKPIDRFEGEYSYLSNFSEHTVYMDGRLWPTAEHAYQAAKTQNKIEKSMIAKQEKSGQAKKMGQKVSLRPGWKDIRIAAMRIIVAEKFLQHPDIAGKLIDTGDAELIEGNWWNDYYWGKCNGKGRNELGKILMSLRTYLQGGKNE
jgi:ribA/ribD-fused uncharacterized protein